MTKRAPTTFTKSFKNQQLCFHEVTLVKQFNQSLVQKNEINISN